MCQCNCHPDKKKRKRGRPAKIKNANTDVNVLDEQCAKKHALEKVENSNKGLLAGRLTEALLSKFTTSSVECCR